MSGLLNIPVAIVDPPITTDDPQLSRSEYALQLRIQLLSLLAPTSCCAACGRHVDLEDLEVDHPEGRTWCWDGVNFLDRIRRCWREHLDGVPLRACCRRCNARDAVRWRGRPRYVPASTRRAA